MVEAPSVCEGGHWLRVRAAGEQGIDLLEQGGNTCEGPSEEWESELTREMELDC